MGNEHVQHPFSEKIDNQKCRFPFVKKKRKNKSLNHKSSQKSCDDFIIRYCQKHKTDPHHNDNPSLDLRRLVFVSLIGLYQTWRKVPIHHLYAALLIMPLKRKWVYGDSDYSQELKACFVSQINAFAVNISDTNEFIELLKWKDTQGLVCWMFDDMNSDESVTGSNPLIAPQWIAVSKKLTNLYDPVTNTNYKPLIFDEEWWLNQRELDSKFSVKCYSILSELYFLRMKFHTIREIIRISNPDSLNPIQTYEDTPMSEFMPTNSSSFTSTSDGSDEFTESRNNWFISSAYDDHV